MEPVRLQKLRKELEERKLDAILITNAFNRRYISGFTGSSGYVLVTADRAWFLTDFRYTEQAAQQAVGFEIIMHQPNVILSVKELLEGVHITKVAFEQDDLSYGTYQAYARDLGGIELVPVSGLVEKLRMYKDEAELDILQQAADLADKTFTHILGFLKPGVTEIDTALEMEFFMRKNGATSSSFDTIVASGVRSALPHGVASEKAIQTGDLVTMDFGALYKAYCSDITRTVGIGKVSPKHREIYDIVLEANLHTLANLKPGMTGKEGDALARSVIEKAGYGDRFGHGTGHSVGLEVHEQPRLSLYCDTVLEPGMVVTVEPGIYLPGFGGVRIEDDVVITETGIRVLTRSTKEFLEIG
ncbi:M24 family metallopeptidase [Gorillibacterium timonense]|uniref:M24 family metallopeptidase n=1 Tax=Gorillibacterium timonense TaxID=1689269 RepID=UPI00071CF589|nr:Xaa-Pro peptidase family protein [Gorillibacterium timonense]